MFFGIFILCSFLFSNAKGEIHHCTLQPGEYEKYEMETKYTMYSFDIEATQICDIYLLTKKEMDYFEMFESFQSPIEKNRKFIGVKNVTLSDVYIGKDSSLMIYDPPTRKIKNIEVSYSVTPKEEKGFWVWCVVHWYVFLFIFASIVSCIVFMIIIIVFICLKKSNQISAFFQSVEQKIDKLPVSINVDPILEIFSSSSSGDSKGEAKPLLAKRYSSVDVLCDTPVEQWDSSHVMTLLYALNLYDYRPNFNLYTGHSLLSEEIFNDEDSSSLLQTLFLGNEHDCAQFLSFVRCLQLLQHRQQNLKRKGIDPFLILKGRLKGGTFSSSILTEIKENRLTIPFLLEMNEEELRTLFVSRYNIRPIEFDLFYKGLNGFFQKKFKETSFYKYINFVRYHKKRRNFLTVYQITHNFFDYINFEEDQHQHQHEDDEEEESSSVCCVCLTNKPSVLFRPCHHLCCCEECSKSIGRTCVLCRQPITQIEKVYTI